MEKTNEQEGTKEKEQKKMLKVGVVVGHKTVEYNQLHGYEIRMLQTHESDIESIKKTVTSLNKEIDSLKRRLNS